MPRRRQIVQAVGIAALALAGVACGDSEPAAYPTTTGGDASIPTITQGTPSTSTVSTAESASAPPKRLQNDRRHPRVDGYWRVAFIPLRTNDPAKVVRVYWQMRPTCKRGQCSFKAIARDRPHGVPREPTALRLDRAIGDYRSTQRENSDCVNAASNAVVVSGGYRSVRQRTLTVSTRRLRGDEWIATRMSGRETTSWTLSKAAIDHNCQYASPELYRMVLVRLGARP